MKGHEGRGAAGYGLLMGGRGVDGACALAAAAAAVSVLDVACAARPASA